MEHSFERQVKVDTTVPGAVRGEAEGRRGKETENDPQTVYQRFISFHSRIVELKLLSQWDQLGYKVKKIKMDTENTWFL